MAKRDLGDCFVVYNLSVEEHSPGLVIVERDDLDCFGLEEYLTVLEILGHLAVLLQYLKEKQEGCTHPVTLSIDTDLLIQQSNTVAVIIYLLHFVPLFPRRSIESILQHQRLISCLGVEHVLKLNIVISRDIRGLEIIFSDSTL